jgi:cation transport regulator ChaB
MAIADVEQCEKIVHTRAPFHAQWWDDPRLGTKVRTWLPADNRQLEAFDAAVKQFFDCVGNVLPSHRRDLYRRLIDRGSELSKRCHSRRDMTIVQGAHYWNCFLPKVVTTFDFSIGTGGASMSAPTISPI